MQENMKVQDVQKKQDGKLIYKGSLYLFARYITVCVLSFVAVPFSSIAPSILNPILGIFYTFMLIYFFVFTMWHEGGRDINRVEIGLIKENKAKGFICAGILAVILCVLVVPPVFFPSDSNNIIFAVWSVARLIFSMSTAYFMQMFAPGSDLMSAVGGNAENLVISTVIFLLLMVVCIVSAGIGYIVGYKRILIFEPLMQKFKKMWK